DRRQGLEIVSGVAQFASAEYLGVTGQHLLQQRRSRTRQADDEHGTLALQTPSANTLEEVGRAKRFHLRDKLRMTGGIVILAALAPGGEAQAVGLAQMLGGLGMFAAGIENLGQTEVQDRTLAIEQILLGKQTAQRGQVLRRQLAAEDGRQLSQCAGMFGIMLEGGAKTRLRRLQVIQFFQQHAEIAVSGSEVGLEAQSCLVVNASLVIAPLLVVDEAQTVMGLGALGVQTESDFVARDGFLVTLALFQGTGEVAVNPCGLGIAPQRLLIPGQGVVDPAFLLESLGHVVVDHADVRIEAQCVGVMRLGLRQLAQLAENIAEIAERLGKVRSQAHGLATMDQRFLPLVLFAQNLAEIGVRLRQARIALNRLAKVSDRGNGIAVKAQGIAEVVVGHGEMRLELESRAKLIDRFRDVAPREQSQAKIIGRLRIVRLQAQGRATRIDGSLNLAQRAPDFAEVGVVGRHRRLKRDGPPD